MNPEYYQKKVQPIDLIDAFDLNFNLGNVIKYTARANYKHDNPKEDLIKAIYYLRRELKKYETDK